MAKRAFERELGMVIDRFHEGSTPCELRMVEADLLLRGPRARGEVARGTVTGFLGRIGEPRPGALSRDQLLAGLRDFEAAAPFGLLAYLDVAGTREALVEATKRVPARGLATYAQALSMIGGDEAAVVLRARRVELLARLDPAAGVIPEEDTRLAMALMSCVVAGLVVDGADTVAARTLIEMMSSRAAWWSGLALANAAELASRLCTRAVGLELVRRELEARARTADLEVFVRIAPYLMLTDQESVISRCEAELSGAAAGSRTHLYNVLRQTTPPSIGIGRLLKWLEREDDVRIALGLMSYLHPLVEESLALRLLQSAFGSESPSLRFNAIGVSNTVSADLRRGLLASALEDEPDPLIARMLQDD